MHFSDGSTLTDKEVWPHELTGEQYASLTSVERVVRGWHLSILKSSHVRNFFIMTEEYQNIYFGTGRPPTPKLALRALGCYLKDSDPPVRIVLGMDPRTYNISLMAEYVNKFRPDGFAKPLKKDTKKLKDMVQKPMPGGPVWSIRKEPPIRRIFSTKNGIGCLIGVNENKRVMAEMRHSGSNCQLLIASG
jgi:hypothetical protein